MNKAVFLLDLATKYNAVGAPDMATNKADFDKRKADLGYSFYSVPVDDLQTDKGGNEVSKTGQVFFKVYDENGPSERVVWEQQAEPRFQQIEDNVFLDAVVNWYETNKKPNIVKFEIIETNKEKEFVIARVFEVVNGTATEKKKFLYREGGPVKVVDLVPLTNG